MFTGLARIDPDQRTNVYASTGLTLGGLWTDMGRPRPSQPAQQVFSRRWIDCSSQASQFSKSSVDAGLIVQAKPASSASLQSTLD